MPNNWIKIEKATPDKPEVWRLARILKIERDAVLGKLVRFWCWLDENSVDGRVDGISPTDIDTMLGCTGIAHSLSTGGWVEFDTQKNTMLIVNFDAHMSKSAKKRALSGARQSRWRNAATIDKSVREQSTRREVEVEVNGGRVFTPLAGSKEQTTTGVPRETIDPAFVVFWDFYPRKDAKADALKAWRAMKLLNGDLEKLMAGLDAQRVSAAWVKDGGQFIPLPASWLRGRRWLDQGATVPDGVVVTGGNGAKNSAPWWSTNAGIEAKAKELGMTVRAGESWNDLKGRVNEKIGSQPQ